MPSISSDARFLGVDLQQLWQEVKRPWLRAHQWPVLAWLTPLASVRLLQGDGKESTWQGDVAPDTRKGAARARFVAVELPEALVLTRKLAMPSMGESDTAKAVELAVRGISPFPDHDLAWGYRTRSLSDGAHQLEMGLASRKQVADYLAAQGARLATGATPEVWVRGEAAAPIVLRGYGEGLRAAHALRWRRAGYGLLVSLLLLLAAVAVTPTAQLRLRALEAVEAFGAAGKRVAPSIRQREALLQSVEQGTALAELLAGRVDPLKILDRLTKVLPDDTVLQSFKLQGAKVSIAGLTSNASTLMQLLGDEKGLRDVRAPAAATRMQGSPKESFVIEFSVDTQMFAAAGTPEVVAAPASAPASAATAPSSAASGALPAVPATSAAAPGASSPPAAVAPPAPPSGGGAVFGGGATFGGTATRPPSKPKP